MKTAITIGTFDGVHRGHRLLLDALVAHASERGMRPIVFVLSPHPLAVVASDRMPEMITTPDRRVEIIRDIYPQTEVRILDFDDSVRSLTKAEFMRILRDEFDAGYLLMGHDNRFGSDPSSGFGDFAATGRRLGLEVERCPALEGVSSSRVRELIREGCVDKAANLLGWHYSLSGAVVHGRKIGRSIGFPTANMRPSNPASLIPAKGVYAAYASFGDTVRRAVVNIGVRPTVGWDANAAPGIEAHLMECDEDLYGKRLTLHYVARMREEKAFPSLDLLAAQLREDVVQASEILSAPEIFSSNSGFPTIKRPVEAL